jgi:hypothetical protein
MWHEIFAADFNQLHIFPKIRRRGNFDFEIATTISMTYGLTLADFGA